MQYSSTALRLLVNHAYCIETIAPHAPLTYFHLKRRHFVTSYVQPVIQQHESKTVKKNFCNQSSHY